MRRLLYGIVLATIVGCSGLLNVNVHNLGPGPVNMTFRYREGEQTEANSFLTVPEGSSASRGLWFSDAPPVLVVEANWTTTSKKRTFFLKDLPPEMQRSSSAARTFDLDVSPDRIEWQTASVVPGWPTRLVVGVIIWAVFVLIWRQARKMRIERESSSSG